MVPDIYLVHPVQDITAEEREFLDKYVAGIEEKGFRVHYPIRDVDQTDQTGGVRILEQHRAAISQVKEVHFFWKPKSRGSVFDFGMAYALKKPIVLVNRDEIEKNLPQRQKSFESVLLKICQDSQSI